MAATSGQQKIMVIFIKKNIGTFEKGQVWSGIDLHQRFTSWIKEHPECRKAKYCIMFPASEYGHRKTKSMFKHFLEETLTLKKNYKTSKYWVKNKDEANRLNLTIKSLS